MASNTKLGKFIEARGVTQAELADKMHISVPALSMKMNGKYPFKQHEMRKLMELFELSGEDVVELFLK